MKKSEVKVGHVYVAKVSDRLVPVRIDSAHSRQGWNATNTKTGRRVHIKSAQRLRCEARDDETGSDAETGKSAADPAKDVEANEPARPTQKADARPKRMSALDAAAEVLRRTGEPMNAKAMIAAMAEQGLWQSPNGKTPEATLYAAILRELKAKGDTARFRKVGRGQFEFNT